MKIPPRNRHSRKARVLLRARIQFEGGPSDGPVKGVGYSTDMNMSGCSIEGAQHFIPGMYLTLRIHLRGLVEPVTVALARVRWAQSQEFGVEFIQFAEKDKLRLGPLIQESSEDEPLEMPGTDRSSQEGPYTILVVDDDADTLHLCVRTLTRQGFTVLQALGSAEAMQICSMHVGMIHLALVDAMLDPPVFQLRAEKRSNLRVHGHMLAQGLMEKRKALRVIMMSASSKTGLKKNGIEIGDVPFLKKPLSREKLLATVRQELERPRFKVA